MIPTVMKWRVTFTYMINNDDPKVKRSHCQKCVHVQEGQNMVCKKCFNLQTAGLGMNCRGRHQNGLTACFVTSGQEKRLSRFDLSQMH